MDILISSIAVAIAFSCLVALLVANFRDQRRLRRAAKARLRRMKAGQ